jgi:hypothetical protein
MMIVPLVSSSVVGPLGLAHLPRLWCKILLHAHGELPEGYRYGNGGFDEKVCEAIGIDRDALVAFLIEERPPYPALETWVRSHATKLDDRSIATWNVVVAGANLPEAMAQERRARFAIPDGTDASSVLLNDLDDWDSFHRALTHSNSSGT